MMVIKVKEYIESCFSQEDVDAILPIINKEVSQNDKVTLDFEGIEYFTTLFFNLAIVKQMGELGVENYEKKIDVMGLSEIGKLTYDHSYDNAIEFYSMTPEQRKARAQIIKEELDSM